MCSKPKRDRTNWLVQGKDLVKIDITEVRSLFFVVMFSRLYFLMVIEQMNIGNTEYARGMQEISVVFEGCFF